MRSVLYFVARIMGDLAAIASGRIIWRILRRVVGWGLGRTLFRWMR